MFVELSSGCSWTSLRVQSDVCPRETLFLEKEPSILDTAGAAAAGVHHRLKSWKTESFSS